LENTPVTTTGSCIPTLRRAADFPATFELSDFRAEVLNGRVLSENQKQHPRCFEVNRPPKKQRSKLFVLVRGAAVQFAYLEALV
jgi:hypothetical protein